MVKMGMHSNNGTIYDIVFPGSVLGVLWNMKHSIPDEMLSKTRIYLCVV